MRESASSARWGRRSVGRVGAPFVALALLALLACATPAAAQRPAATPHEAVGDVGMIQPSAPLPGELAPEVKEFVERVNRHRQEVGCRPLLWHEPLAAMAQRYSTRMATEGFYGHDDPEGRTLIARLNDERIGWIGAGENLAITEHGAEQVLFLWLQSDRHRRNIEDCSLVHHGVGLHRGRWTHLFLTAPPWRLHAP